MIGYVLTIEGSNAKQFVGGTPDSVADGIRDEIDSNGGLSVGEIPVMTIGPVEISQVEIDRMNEFEGW